MFFSCRFLIGREKEGVESEVARLINESLEMDKSKKVCPLVEVGGGWLVVTVSVQFNCACVSI